jgi:hypothetical protein
MKRPNRAEIEPPAPATHGPHNHVPSQNRESDTDNRTCESADQTDKGDRSVAIACDSRATGGEGVIRVTTTPIKKMRRRQRRKRKLRLLRRRLAEAKSLDERRRLTAKIRRFAPHVVMPDV